MRDDFDAKIKLKFFPDDDSDDGGDDDDSDDAGNDGDGDGDDAGDDDDDDDDDDEQVCALPGVPDDPAKGVRRHKIKFSTKDMKEIFEQTFKEITKLVQAQVTAVQQTTKQNVHVGA